MGDSEVARGAGGNRMQVAGAVLDGRGWLVADPLTELERLQTLSKFEGIWATAPGAGRAGGKSDKSEHDHA